MQINYPNFDRRAVVLMWNVPTEQNTLLDWDVPPNYAPYPTPGYWPGHAASEVLSLAGLGQDAASVDTLLSPLPSITTAAPTVVLPPANCGIAGWVAKHPTGATLAAVLTFLIFTGGRK